MEEELNISEKERERRRKISVARRKAILKKREELRIKGLKAYWKRKRKERREREKEEKKLKLKKKKEKERERQLKIKSKKRKVGRPKKLGRPKKQYKCKWKIRDGNGGYTWKVVEGYSRGRKLKSEFKYKIISCCNGIQNKFIGRYREIEDAYRDFEDLKKKDELVVFPMETVREARKGFVNAVNEYILIEKSDKENALLRNEYGKLVEQKTNADGWIVIDKYQYKKEETFWVFGYNNKTERKTFEWIYNSLLTEGIYLKLDFKRVLIYRNKVVFEDTNDYMDIIICKTYSDAVRLYNALQKQCTKDKIKQVLFVGDYSNGGEAKKELERKLMEVTGWTKKKVQMLSSVYN